MCVVMGSEQVVWIGDCMFLLDVSDCVVVVAFRLFLVVTVGWTVLWSSEMPCFCLSLMRLLAARGTREWHKRRGFSKTVTADLAPPPMDIGRSLISSW